MGTLGAGVAFALCWSLQLPPAMSLPMLLVCGAVPMWWLEGRRNSTQAEERSERAESRDWVLGALAVVTLVAASTAAQLNWGGAKTRMMLDVVPAIAGAVVLMLVLSWQDWRAGLLEAVSSLGTILRKRSVASEAALTVLLGWCVKAVFVPLMLVWCHVWLALAVQESILPTVLGGFMVVVAFLYSIDTCFAVIGYVNTSARIAAQIRSVDQTWLGWLSALVCYPPLSVLVLDTWLVYKTSEDWLYWFARFPIFGAFWGLLVVLTTGIYVWATVVFGPRFSNLTYRGLITSGPYRFVRHPAYLSKNLSWWLIFTPFLSSQGWRVAVMHSLALLAINGIYWLRAWTEERHLSRYPEYLAYVDWIRRNGLWALLMGRRDLEGA